MHPRIPVLLTVLAAGFAAQAQPVTPPDFPTSAAAFIAALDACDEAYSGAALAKKTPRGEPGPFTRRGLQPSTTGDEAKLALLMQGQEAVVFKAQVRPPDPSVVYLVMPTSAAFCRVGVFDGKFVWPAVLAHLSEPASGWRLAERVSPDGDIAMRTYAKVVGPWTLSLNLSARQGERPGPEGQTMMATMAVTASTQ